MIIGETAMIGAPDRPGSIPPELRYAVETLASEFAGIHAPETVARVLVDTYQRLAATARVTGYLPLLASRFARDQLLATDRVRETSTPSAHP